VSDGRELEPRIERLEMALLEIDTRLARLEHRPAAAHPAAAPAPSAASAPSAVPAPSEGNLLGLAGICTLILGGAFVLRAVTESRMIPPLGGVVFGLAYAAVWIWNADRLARAGRRRAALFHAVTAALIAFPLVWETSVRFHTIPPEVAGVIDGTLGLLFLWIAVRNRQQLLAWTGSVAAVLVGFGVGVSISVLVVLSVLGAATMIAAKEWEFASWPAALAANAMALVLAFTHGPGAAATLIVYCAIWIVPAAIGRGERDIVIIVQATAALLIGIGGATLLLLPAGMASLLWCGFGVLAAEVAHHTRLRIMGVQSVLWIGAALFASGLLLSIVGAFVSEGPSIELPAAALGNGIAALVACVRLPAWRPERLVLASIFLGMVFNGTLVVLGPRVTNTALLRTAVLAAAASLLAVLGRLIDSREASLLARAVLIIGGVKLLAEDLRLGRAAVLVVSFALYGAALLIVSRSGWSRPPAEGTGSGM